LSARITNVRYLKTITQVSDQKTSERMPRMLTSSGRTPCSGLKHSFIA
jgi:hypothetical protein